MSCTRLISLHPYGDNGYRHGTTMKSLFSLIFLFLLSNSAFAANLCDTSCNLTISFPAGGSIEATEALTFTFGTGGVLDLGATGTINTVVQPASTDFSTGGTLVLAAGESISFDAGGSLDLGTGGNLDYSNIMLTTEGDIDIQSIGGTESILLNSITIVGAGILTITGLNINIVGSILTDGDVFIVATYLLVITGGIVIGDSLSPWTESTNWSDPSGCDTSSSSGSTISFGDLTITATNTNIMTSSDPYSLTVSTPCSNIINVIDPLIFDVSVIQPINVSSLTTLTEITIDGVLYTVEYKMVDGVEVQVFVAPDGTI